VDNRRLLSDCVEVPDGARGMRDIPGAIMLMLGLGLAIEILLQYLERKHGMDRRRMNPPVLKCPACRSDCLRHFSGFNPRRWTFWVGFCVWVLVMCPLFLPDSLPTGWALLIGLPMVNMKGMAEDRLYHQWWSWKHPTRCQGGGEPEPAPSGA
jgi:hypothetical protein